MPDRVEPIRQRLQEFELAAFLVSSPSSLRYIFGFSGSNGLGVITSRDCYFITDWRYRDQAGEEVTNAEIIIVYRDPFAKIKEKKILEGIFRIGFEDYHLTYRQIAQFNKHFPKLKLAMTENLIPALAMQKSPDEIEKLRKAGRMAGAVWDRILPTIRAGVAEFDIAAEIVYHARKFGSETEAFDPIVASGPRSALPHAKSTARKLRHGDMVVVDFGCVYEGYHSDVTRTVSVGEPASNLMEVYRVVKEAVTIACEAIRPNMKAVDLDKIARDHIEKHGFADHFNHSLGHGIGLEVHGMPRIGPTSKDLVPVDCVITIEPGVYLPGQGGVRIEDDVLVKESGYENLTPILHELVCVD